MKSTDIRKAFLTYFKDKGHDIVPSSPLVPANDPTLLFTNAGMVQFKDVFLGAEKRPYTRAVSSQRCVRAGGKHNDLDNVGHTARHHTFFEMLGNFSFGDYFKKEAIAFSWEFLTEVLGLPKEKLWVSVYKEDNESADIWMKDVGVPKERISYCEAASNFWEMGDTGPCGPCTEIFYDHGPDIFGGPPGSPDEDGDRYIEIWNLVFMQYNRSSDGKLDPLPKPSVDTGMGLERLAAVLQGVHNNYDTDVFQPLIQKAAELGDVKDTSVPSLKVIADHIRSASFLIADGVAPSNEGRGYVLRRIIRRAIRHGYMLNLPQPFFYRLVPTLVTMMGNAYPELKKSQTHIETLLKREEELFDQTLSQGMKLLNKEIDALTGVEIPGDVVFRLYDTYGFPVDLTADIAREKSLTLDMQSFDHCMEKQQAASRAASKFTVDYGEQSKLAEALKKCNTHFVGYENVTIHGAKIVTLFKNGEPVNMLKTNETGLLVLDQTPFYAEGGGQVGDAGECSNDKARMRVFDTTKIGTAYLHHVDVVEGDVHVGDALDAAVNQARRQATVLNHSATHLLHHVLRRCLGEHVIQKGSLVAPDRLRFDFSHHSPLTKEELREIETEVNAAIRANAPAEIKIMSPEVAIKQGAMALFGEKYDEKVRVLRLGDSIELCGGTHAARTGDIGVFKIIAESGVAAGVRRIEAVTAEGALAWFNQTMREQEIQLDEAQQKIRSLEKQMQHLNAKLATNAGGELVSEAKEIAGIKVLAVKVSATNVEAMRQMMDQLKQKLGSAIVVLASVNDDASVSLLAGVTKDQIAHVKAGEIVNMVAAQVGGRGGGRPDLAQAGGNEPEALDDALQSVYAWVKDRLQ